MRNITQWSLSFAVTLAIAMAPAIAITLSNPSESEDPYADAPIQLAACDKWWKIFVEKCNVSRPRDSINPNIPYIITPRETKIQQERPLIRWNSVDGIDRYQLQVKGPLNMEPVTVMGNEWQYPTHLPLEPGIRYRVNIVARGTSCFRLGWGSPCQMGFKVLTNEETVRLEEDLAALSPSERNNPLEVADIYQRYELYADAVNLLEQAISTGNTSREYHQFLGELYEQIMLDEKALEQYRAALIFAEAEEDVLTQASLSTAMGQVNFTLTNFQVAVQWWERAREHLQQLGYDEKAEGLELWIEDARNRID